MGACLLQLLRTLQQHHLNKINSCNSKILSAQLHTLGWEDCLERCDALLLTSGYEPAGITFGIILFCFFNQLDLIRSSAGQVGKVLGERWKALNDKQRAPYEAKAAQDKKRHEDEKAS
ncbi:uncharacterized protein LY89DRAFT_672754 [Mollisia scopiformis]|uniref:HMG box domain-containing protein n=1 Tax=Mollisia scopiformis TaxID=149040 RepID=A0A194X021_MOLSC|nr:uncharacterized protein LY89DRAFT_672754 [Mollisia scopiformis]KUJ13548.1 hypothetical protein LY89DRAFT_672754 [Mollisia scopiformis]